MSGFTSDKGKGLWQFIKFVLVGVSNTVISEGVYAVLVFFKVHYLPASFIGFSLSVINAYYWSSRYVFKEKEDGEKRVWWQVFAKTYLAYFWGYLVNAALLVLWIDILGIASLTAPLGEWCAGKGFASLDGVFWGNLLAAAINLAITVPMNFVLNKYWAYRQKKKQA
jgi:putative flippase GtrA